MFGKNLKKIISFCLYGELDFYNQGAIENVIEARRYFPSWDIQFYVSEKCPVKNQLEDLGADVFQIGIPNGTEAMLWRYLPLSDCTASHVICRDTDQRLSHKDSACVKHWISLDCKAHKIVETEGQASIPIMGGAFGVKPCFFQDMESNICDWLGYHAGWEIGHTKKRNGKNYATLTYGGDQTFLKEVVWPVVMNDCVTFGWKSRPFPWHIKPQWGKNVFERIAPFCDNKIIVRDRPVEAYALENE